MYRKKRYSRPSRSRRTYRKRKQTSLRSEVNKLKRMSKPEFKVNDTDLSGTPGAGSNTPKCVSTIGVGTGRAGRIGVSIRLMSLQYCIKITQHASATDTAVRVICYLDKQNNGAVSSVTDLLVTESTTSLKNNLSERRFWIISDRLVDLSANAYTEKTIKYYKRFNIITKFNAGTAGTATDIDTNSLYILLISDEATNTPTVVGSARLKYVDV